ncbi:MAG: hypothetical protein WC761_06645 [Candidatus Paceibacterota bacterium]|jgi:hypothetical protein
MNETTEAKFVKLMDNILGNSAKLAQTLFLTDKYRRSQMSDAVCFYNTMRQISASALPSEKEMVKSFKSAIGALLVELARKIDSLPDQLGNRYVAKSKRAEPEPVEVTVDDAEEESQRGFTDADFNGGDAITWASRNISKY